jgi:hypothetical protein
MTWRPVSWMLLPMSTNGTSCQGCGRPVEQVVHVLLCDRCLDARLAQPARAERRGRLRTLTAAILAVSA